ncbi:MAG TPA: hypothetical protein VMN36_13870 [Verrucomicrobiales bacterium]|nr:hypothetical protein [Verrucomicrobiales bacterium]
MPEPNEDKDHYSYDEIMDHLKRVHSRHGVKSKKKRRRRSHQPVKEKRRTRFLTALTVLVLFLLAAVIGVSLFFSHLYYETEKFRVEASQLIGEITGLEAEFQGRFTVDQSRFVNKQLLLKGREDLMVYELNFTGIRATVPLLSLLRSIWDTDLLVDNAEGKLKPARPANTSASAPARKDEVPSSLVAGLGFQRLPKAFLLNRLAIQRLSLDFGADARNPHSIRDVSLLCKRTPNHYFIDVRTGHLKFGSWPVFRISSADATLDSEGAVHILESNLSEEGGGTCDVTGDLRFLGDDPGADLTAALESIQLHRAVHPSWQERVVGTVSGQIRLQAGFREDDPFLLSGTLSGDGVALKRLDLLSELSRVSGLDLFQRLECKEFTVKFEQDRDRIRLYDMSAATSEIFLLHGEVTIHQDERLEGSFELGLPNALLARFHHLKPQFFEARGSNVSWAKFEISGTLSVPQDTLITQFREGYPPPPLTRTDLQIPQPRLDREEEDASEERDP